MTMIPMPVNSRWRDKTNKARIVIVDLATTARIRYHVDNGKPAAPHSGFETTPAVFQRAYRPAPKETA